MVQSQSNGLLAEQMENAAQPLRDVRIVYLPASEVAAAHFIGEDPEDRAGEMLSDFVRGTKLWEKHPGLRVYGFNHPSPMDETGFHGYEFWVTVPEGTGVPKPLEKKHFPGGTYAITSSSRMSVFSPRVYQKAPM